MLNKQKESGGRESTLICIAWRWAFAILAGCILSNTQVDAGAFEFQEPADWEVGQANSTFQEWKSSSETPFAALDSPATSVTANPALVDQPTMGRASPGFVAGSGGYYALSGSYGVFADVFNHGGNSAGHGTRVLVQTASTVNEEAEVGGPASVFTDSIEIVQHDGSPIAGGDNASLLQTTELFLGNVLTSFGIVPQQELLFEFWLPDFTGDFRVQFDTIVHSSFSELRVDSLIAEAELTGDFDADGDFDGADFLAWQRDHEALGGAMGLDAWNQNYGTPSGFSAIASVPEPTTLVLLLLAVTGFGKLNSRRQRQLPRRGLSQR